MSIFGDIVAKAIGPLVGMVDGFHFSGEEKGNLKARMLETQVALAIELEKAAAIEADAKKAVIVAELQHGDAYTKRARPTVVFAGLLLALINHVVLPWTAHFTGSAPPTIEIPTMFWTAWGGICGTWVIGRTMERRGVQNKMISTITGS